MVGIQLHSRVSEKGQVVIPKPIRKQLNIQPNTELIFDIENEKIIVRRKESGLQKFEDFITAVKKKRKFPKQIDWDKEYYSQFE